jgi:uncharacterized membrane protein (DUF373 family)
MKSIITDLTKDTVNLILNECQKDENKQRLKSITNDILKVALNLVQPYLYTIIAILILLFIMNCFQFYYYIKLFISTRENLELQLDDIITKTI